METKRGFLIIDGGVGCRELTVGFARDPSLPLLDRQALRGQNQASASFQKKLKSFGSQKPVGVDEYGRRVNICGGFVDSVRVRLPGYVKGHVIRLLARCGYSTICDLSRDLRRNVETIPGIGPKAMRGLDAALAAYGLRYLRDDEKWPTLQTGGVNPGAIRTELSAVSVKKRRSAIALVEDCRRQI